jgi:NhaP-type Na+/H+ or K+/H+ antiporter
MITAVFGSFLMAETVFIVSGVLTVVTFGLWMSQTGKYIISPSSTELIENFNQVVAYNTEVIIFFIAGVVSFVSIYDGDIYDWINLAYCYVIIHLVRFTVVFFFYPICLRHSGYNLKVKEALIIVYGGLRGAVGLALALIAAGQLDKVVGENIMFITSGIVVLTMVINGTTTGMVYAKLRPFHPLVSENEKGETESLRQELVTMGFNKIRHQVTTLEWIKCIGESKPLSPRFLRPYDRG